MAVNDIFKKVPIEIPNKSGFDMSHEHVFNAKVGTLVPCMTDLLIPGDTVSLGVSSEIQLPPMATDFYGRVKAHFETFFVPFRILYQGWQELITHPVTGDIYPSGTTILQKAKYLPSLLIPLTDAGPMSLSDYLGLQINPSTSETSITVPNPLRYLAYHKIYDSFYRDSRIQQEVFRRPNQSATPGSTFTVSYLPYVTKYDSTPLVLAGDNLLLADGVKVQSLRQRNFGRDYFTNMTPQPQAGSQSQLAFTVDTGTGAGSFSIASLRAANSLQGWLERNNIAGYRYADQIKAQFGVYPSDAALDRPVYLGREIVDVYNKSVYNNAGVPGTSDQNPFSTVGAKYGSPLGVGSGRLVDKFTATEHGYIMTIFSLVPDTIYDGGIEREFEYNSSAHFPFPLLAGIGDQAIKRKEILCYANSGIDDEVIGYTQRYANHKFMRDRVSGLLRDGQSLDSFALTRSFGAGVTLGTQLLQIPTSYLDDVAAVNGDVSNYGCWVDSFYNYHKVSTLPAYSIPTLGDLKNTHTEVVDNGGFRL